MNAFHLLLGRPWNMTEIYYMMDSTIYNLYFENKCIILLPTQETARINSSHVNISTKCCVLSTSGFVTF